jgi:hypothetical protein
VVVLGQSAEAACAHFPAGASDQVAVAVSSRQSQQSENGPSCRCCWNWSGNLNWSWSWNWMRLTWFETAQPTTTATGVSGWRRAWATEVESAAIGQWPSQGLKSLRWFESDLPQAFLRETMWPHVEATASGLKGAPSSNSNSSISSWVGLRSKSAFVSADGISSYSATAGVVSDVCSGFCFFFGEMSTDATRSNENKVWL